MSRLGFGFGIGLLKVMGGNLPPVSFYNVTFNNGADQVTFGNGAFNVIYSGG